MSMEPIQVSAPFGTGTVADPRASGDDPAAQQRLLICASCGAQTSTVPCADCGRNPLLRGRYRLLEVGGGDPSGMAYKALDTRHPTHPIEVRLVPLSPEGATALAMNLADRVEQLRRPRSPPVRAVHSAFLVGRGRRQAVAIVQPAVTGVRLDAELGRRSLSRGETESILLQVVETVAALHAQQPPMPSGALGPDRLLRLADGDILLPYAGDLDGHGEAAAGAPRAPELATAAWAPTADVFQLGLLGVRLITGRDPATMTDPRGVLAWEHQTAAPIELVEMLRRWLAPRPADRPADAGAALAELRALRPGHAPDPSAPTLAFRRGTGSDARLRFHSGAHRVHSGAHPTAARPGSPADPRRIAPTRAAAPVPAPIDPAQQKASLLLRGTMVVLAVAAILALITTIQGLTAVL